MGGSPLVIRRTTKSKILSVALFFGVALTTTVIQLDFPKMVKLSNCQFGSLEGKTRIDSATGIEYYMASKRYKRRDTRV